MANEGGGKGKPPSAGLAAWNALRKSKELDGAAARALEKADLVGLEALKASGWMATGEASRGWFNAAMSEPSGASVRWLLEHYPSQVAGGPMWGALAEDPEGWPSGSDPWTSRALAEIDDIGIRSLGPMKWLKLALESSEAGKYLASSFAGDSAWKDGECMERSLLAMLKCSTFMVDEGAWEACADCAASWVAEALKAGAQDAAPGIDWATLALEALRTLDFAWTTPEIAAFSLRVCKSLAEAGVQGLNLSQARLDWSKGGSLLDASMKSTNLASQDWRQERSECYAPLACPVGLSILLEGGPRGLKAAVDLGWVGEAWIKTPMPKENPDFVAWDIAQAKKLGLDNPEAEARRWASCRKGFEIACMDEPARRSWLARIDAPDASLWRPEMHKKIALARDEAVSPMTLLLASERMWDAAFERKAMILSERGWSVSDALASGGAVRGLAEKMVKAAAVRSQKALARIIEREEIEKSAPLPMGASAKAARL